MKKFKCLLTAMLLACSTASFAQFTNGGGGGGVSSDVEAWKGLRFSYDRTFTKIDINGAEDQDYNGFSVGYEHAFKIAKKLPIFFQTGLNLNFARYSDSESDEFSMGNYFGSYESTEEWKTSTNVLGLTIPLNFVYGVKINDMLAIKPYTGFYLRVNLMSKTKYKHEIGIPSEAISDMQDAGMSQEDINEVIANFNENYEVGEETENNFDEKEVGKDEVWNRCQFGWQIGATLDINQFNVGIGYALDFNEICEKTKTSKFAVTVGMNF